MADIPSPQAILPVFRTWDELMKNQLVAQHLDVLPPNIKTGTGAEDAFPVEEGVAMRFMQNCGLEPVKVCIGDTATADVFHFILAGCSAVDDGLGSIVDVSKYKGKVSIYSAAAHRVATFRAYAPERA